MFINTNLREGTDFETAKRNHTALKQGTNHLLGMTAILLIFGVPLMYLALKCDDEQFSYFNIFNANDMSEPVGLVQSELNNTHFINDVSRALNASSGHILSPTTIQPLEHAKYIGAQFENSACSTNDLYTNISGALLHQLRKAVVSAGGFSEGVSYYGATLTLGVLFLAGGITTALCSVATIYKTRFWGNEAKRLDPNNQPLLLGPQPIGHDNPVARPPRQTTPTGGLEMSYKAPGAGSRFFPFGDAGARALSMPSPHVDSTYMI
ncbi:MAG: hypothetical protein P1U34_00310 [Coxiellaceae bacterium]|nr:hypothetical protein [Coxiellaceae bacterium]